MIDPDVDWKNLQKTLSELPQAAAVTDCKSVYDTCTRTAIPSCEEYRTTLECSLIRERLKEGTTLRWVSSQAQLADCLTKVMEAGTLRECLQTGKYALFDEAEVLKERAIKKANKSWITEDKTREPFDVD